MFEKVVGKTVKAQYKRANRESVEIAIEVTAKLVLPTSRGNVAYLFGTRMDAEKAGVIGLFRADCFRPSSVVVEDAPNFKRIEGYAEGEWYATTGNMSFGYPERVAAKDLEWALEAGAKPLMDFAVA